MTTLLDGNVLVALSFTYHTHAQSADPWFANLHDSFATCPITQGTLLRHALREGLSADDARDTLARITNHRRHIFWPDDISYNDVRMTGVMGHRQVTDAYLAQLARHHGARLATFDEGLAVLHSDVADLIPIASNGV